MDCVESEIAKSPSFVGPHAKLRAVSASLDLLTNGFRSPGYMPMRFVGRVVSSLLFAVQRARLREADAFPALVPSGSCCLARMS